MANLVAPRGFVPVRHINGSSWNGKTTLYCIPSTDGNQINPGDAVKSAAGADANGVPYITKITNGTDTARGVVVGLLVAAPNTPSFQGTNLDLTVQNAPATKTRDYYALVVDAPDVIYEISDDGLSALSSAAANKNASYTVTNPTAPQQNSATTLLNSSVATTQGLPLKLLGLVQRPDNAFGVNAKWLVMFNQHELMGNTAGV